MFRRKPPEASLPSQDFPEYLVPATLAHYTLWLEGYLLSGGDYALFEGPYFPLYHPDVFIAEMALVTGDYDEDAGVKSEYRGVVVPDHITDVPPAPTRYMLATDRIEGIPNVRIYPMPQFREFAPLFAQIFTNSLASQLIHDANPEHEGSPPFGTGYWQKNREATLRKYRYLAEYFDLELSEDFVQDALRRAVALRRDKKEEMATPEYQQRQVDGFTMLIEMSKKALRRDDE